MGVSEASEGSWMAVASLAKVLVALLSRGVALSADASPVVEGIAEALVTAVAHLNG